MIEEIIELRKKLDKIKKDSPELGEMIELSILVGRAITLSELCGWGKNEASDHKEINHFSLLAFAEFKEKELRLEVERLIKDVKK